MIMATHLELRLDQSINTTLPLQLVSSETLNVSVDGLLMESECEEGKIKSSKSLLQGDQCFKTFSYPLPTIDEFSDYQMNRSLSSRRLDSKRLTLPPRLPKRIDVDDVAPRKPTRSND